MLNTETYLRDMTREMGANHEPIASRPYTEMWDNYLNTENNICVFAPRQSGKTYALKHKFLNTPNSVFITTHRFAANNIISWCRTKGNHRHDLDYSRDIFTYMTAYRMGSRCVDTIFIDDIDAFQIHLDRFMNNFITSVSRGGRIIMVTTPARNNSRELYERYCNCVNLPCDWIDINRTSVPIENYFEDELFEI